MRDVAWFRQCNYLKGILNHTMLLRQGVESNPGPLIHKIHKSNVSVRTYNCNGLGVTDKSRRILIKIRKEVASGGIIMLQETHIKCLAVLLLNHLSIGWAFRQLTNKKKKKK